MSLKTKDKHALLKSYSQPDERLLLAKVLDQADLSLKKHIICFTDFIAPAMLAEIEELLRKYDGLKTKQFGGYDDAERKMIAVFPEYIDEEDIYFPLGAVGISYNKKFTSSISHRDYLGSIMGLGIERGKVGDIVAMDGEAICFAEQSIADYILSNLERVGHTKVKTQKADINQLRLPEKKMDIKNITVSSLRADTVFGAVFGNSRSETQDLIRAERASVNWTVVRSSSEIIKEGDILSLKGGGRGKLIEVGGTTKKGRLVITVGRYV